MNNATAFDNYEISPCRRYKEPGKPGQFYFEPCNPSEADVWTLYGHIPDQGVEAIGDFSTLEFAEEVYCRITGQAFVSHEQNEARIRLMHAAPALLKALEPYAIEAKNRIFYAGACDSDETDTMNALFQPLLDAYRGAIARPAGADAVTVQIEGLMATNFIEDRESGEMNPVAVAVGAPIFGDHLCLWVSLDAIQQEIVLSKFIDWDGFDWCERGVVTKNVIAGKPKDRWFSDIGRNRNAFLLASSLR